MELDEIDERIAVLWAAVFSTVTLVILLATLAAWLVISIGTTRAFLPGEDLSNVAKISISVLAVFVNLLFSTGLVYLYFRQARTQEDQKSLLDQQTSIQEQQRKIMEAEYIPVVDIHVSEVLQDCIRIECVNSGTGLAKSFQVEVEFFVSEDSMDGPADFHDGVELERLSEMTFRDEEEVPNYGTRIWEAVYNGEATTPHQHEVDTSFASTHSTEILREEDDDELQFTIYFNRSLGPGEEPTRLSFQEGVEALRNEGMGTLGYTMYVSYDDIFDEQVDRSILASGWIDIRDEVTLRELIEADEDTGIFTHRHPFRSEEVITAHHYSYL